MADFYFPHMVKVQHTSFMGKTIQVYGFPCKVTAEEVKRFLESLIGEGTVYAIEVRKAKNGGPRAYAIVQFTTNIKAEYIISLARPKQSLWYESSYLNARPMEHDIVPKPRTYKHTMEKIMLHFGCQISNETFAVLWRGVDVSVNFGIGMRKLNFYLSYRQVKYWLELAYENIWQIELHRPRNQRAKYLLIQVAFLPLITD